MSRITGFDTPEEWYEEEEILFDRLIEGDQFAGNDHQLQDYFDAAFFDPDATADERGEAYEDLVNHLRQQYGIDFDVAFDWEDYRAWYEAAA